jgi:NADH-quinone oxidoreductase subunit J
MHPSTMRLVARLVGLGLLVLLCGPAAAQAVDGVAPTGEGRAQQRGPQAGLVAAEGTRVQAKPLGGHAAPANQRDASEAPGFHNSRMAALFFWIFALGTLGGGIFVITRRNLITAVMGMVGTFFALAGLYLMLYASFLAVIQVLVYAGAIMVLFVFVVMILNRPEDEPWALQGLLGKALAGLAIAYLVLRLGAVLWDLKDTPHAAVSAPRPVAEILPGQPADFGSVRAVGNTLFRDYLFPFEAVSLVLLTAVVGAIAVARPHHPQERHDEGGHDESDPVG